MESYIEIYEQETDSEEERVDCINFVSETRTVDEALLVDLRQAISRVYNNHGWRQQRHDQPDD